MYIPKLMQSECRADGLPVLFARLRFGVGVLCQPQRAQAIEAPLSPESHPEPSGGTFNYTRFS